MLPWIGGGVQESHPEVTRCISALHVLCPFAIYLFLAWCLSKMLTVWLEYVAQQAVANRQERVVEISLDDLEVGHQTFSNTVHPTFSIPSMWIRQQHI